MKSFHGIYILKYNFLFCQGETYQMEVFSVDYKRIWQNLSGNAYHIKILEDKFSCYMSRVKTVLNAGLRPCIDSQLAGQQSLQTNPCVQKEINYKMRQAITIMEWS